MVSLWPSLESLSRCGRVSNCGLVVESRIFSGIVP